MSTTRRRLRCALGIHKMPRRKAFSCVGAVYAGGSCACCSDSRIRQGRFLGHVGQMTGSGFDPIALAGVLKKMGYEYTGEVDM